MAIRDVTKRDFLKLVTGAAAAIGTAAIGLDASSTT